MKPEIEIDNLNEQKEKSVCIVDETEASVKSKISTYTDVSRSQRKKEKWIANVSKEERKSSEIWENFFL